MDEYLSTALLVPPPRQLQWLGPLDDLPTSGLIVIDAPDPQALLFTAQALQAAVREVAGATWEIVAGRAVPGARIRLLLSVSPGSVRHEQGYTLTIDAGRITLLANRPAGIYYAAQTLKQLWQQLGPALPALRCRDWPDFPQRGVLLDVSRDKVPRMDTLYALVDRLASWKINQLQLYTEHTFAYRNHPLVWTGASPLTGEEVLALDAYCRRRFVELVPNQNTFGHMQRWLQHEAYAHLAEQRQGLRTPWGSDWSGPFSLAPAHPGSLELVRGLLDELLPHFSSRQVNVGCDETFDLGAGQSGQIVAERGRGRVYLDYLLEIYRALKVRGKTMQFWGDIILQHPDLIPRLPADAVALVWGYEANHPFDAYAARFARAGLPFYVCPGTSSWRSLAGRTDNAIANLRAAAASGLAHGAAGYLITDWGDEGHWQPLPASYPGFLYGAALSWNHQGSLDLDIPVALDRLVFRDRAGVMGRLACDLGNIYQEPGILFPNSSALFHALQSSPVQIRRDILGRAPQTVLARIQSTLDRIHALASTLDAVDIQAAEAALVRREFHWVAAMLGHACRRIRWAQDGAGGDALAREAGGLIDEFGAIWQARNRAGGFQDSLARLEAMQQDYWQV